MICFRGRVGFKVNLGCIVGWVEVVGVGVGVGVRRVVGCVSRNRLVEVVEYLHLLWKT